MLHLLKIVVSGYKMLSDNFTIDFTTKAKVTDDIESEVYRIDENLYAFSIISYTGSNASGKTTVVRLINNCLRLIQTGRWVYNKRDFSSDKIKLYFEFYKDGIIYLYQSEVYPSAEENLNDKYNGFCKIVNEKIKMSVYKSYAGKNYLKKLAFKEENASSGIEDTSSLQYFCRDQMYVDFMTDHNIISISDNYFNNLNKFSLDLISSIVTLLDESIEYIKYTNDLLILFKRYNEEEVTLRKSELLQVLSNGTIKGIELFTRIIIAIKKGGYFIIDEIENCFHKNLVDNIMNLFNDKSINKNDAKIIFTTHYVEILDYLNRRDNINILHKVDGKIFASNLYIDYKPRTEILKSKQFNSNTFNTLLNYELLMKMKRMIKDEISNND